MASGKTGISLCMIVKDEQDFLEDCLQSVREAVDEILVADTGSSDNTVEIARRCGAQVYEYAWDSSFSNARNFIMEKASGQWILLLDADERLFPEDVQRLAAFVRTSSGDGAHFKVYNLVGEYGSGQYTLHNALRLVRNNGLYHFVGDIHEQIARIDGQPMDGLFPVTDIRLHHLGYLDGVVSRKHKRERNIPLLLGELSKDPENPFMLFNLGNEYMAMKDYEEALSWYEKSQLRFTAKEAFGPHLLFRIALCHYNMGAFTKTLEALAKGLAVYPGCTDMVYFRGRAYMEKHLDMQAAESFHQAIEMGPAHASLRFSDDCATIRPYMSLAELYARQQDYQKAALYYAKAIHADNKLHGALYGMAEAYKKMGCSPQEIEKYISALFSNLDHVPNRIVLTDVLLFEGLWEICEKHIALMEAAGEYPQEVALLRGKYDLARGAYRAAAEKLQIAVQASGPARVLPEVEKESAMLLFAARLIQEDSTQEEREQAAEQAGKAFGPPGEKLCRQVLSLLAGKEENLLEGAEPEQWMALMARLLKILLECRAFELFEETLYAYNYIDSSKVLLDLGRLYLECGFPGLAAQTILRSIKELNAINAAGARVLLESLMQEKEESAAGK